MSTENISSPSSSSPSDSKRPIQSSGSSTTNSVPFPTTSSPYLVSSSAPNAVILGRNTLTPLTAPKSLSNTEATAFLNWKNAFTGYCLSQSILDVVETDAQTLFDKAVLNNPSGRSLATLSELFQTLHSQVVGVLFQATEGVIGRSLFDTLDETTIVSGGFAFTFKYNANKYWTKLCLTYERKTVFSIATIWNSLLNLKYKEGEHPMHHKKRFDELMLQLKQVDAGTNLSDTGKAAILTRTLPSSLDATVQNILASPVVTLESIWEALFRRFDVNSGNNGKGNRSNGTGESANTFTGDTNGGSRNHNKTKSHFKKKHNNHNNNRSNNKNGSWCMVESSMDDPVGDYNSEYEEDEYNESYIQEHANAASADGTYVGARREFILDSGATKHIVFDPSLLKKKKQVDPIRLTCAMKKSVIVNTVGSVQLNSRITLNDVAAVPAAGANLISVSRILDSGYTVNFLKTKAVVYDRNREEFFSFPRVGALYMYTQPDHNQDIEPPSFEVAPPAKGQIPKRSDRVRTNSIKPQSRTEESEANAARRHLNQGRASGNSNNQFKSQDESAHLLMGNRFYPLLNLSSETVIPTITTKSSAVSSHSSPSLTKSIGSQINKATLWHARLAHQASSTLAGAKVYPNRN